jgi:hypothetical protein
MKRMRLVSTPKFKKKYKIAVLYGMDEQVYSFDLTVWNMYTDIEWIEFIHKDGNSLESFNTVNVLRISFTKEEVKLKPVPRLTNNLGA